VKTGLGGEKGSWALDREEGEGGGEGVNFWETKTDLSGLLQRGPDEDEVWGAFRSWGGRRKGDKSALGHLRKNQRSLENNNRKGYGGGF